MVNSTNFLIIGAGPAGVCAANILSKSGQKVIVISKVLGGSYCQSGSIVSKSLFRLAEMFEKYRIINTSYIDNGVDDYNLDFKKIKKNIDSQVNKAKKLFNESMEKNNIVFIEGAASFIDQNTVEVQKVDGDIEVYTFDKCLIATGSIPTKTSLSSGKKYSDLTSFISMEDIPDSVAVIGGGVVGLEVASLFNRFGAKVTIVEKNDRILCDIDAYIVKKYEDSLKKRGVNIITNYNITKLERVGQKYIALSDTGQIESEEVFVCIGRVPDINELNLEKAGVECTEDGAIVYSKSLQTSNSKIFIAGDVSHKVMNSSWAYYSASIAAKNMLGESLEYNPDTLPLYVSTNPDIAKIGLSEDDAKSQGLDCGVIKYICGDVYGFSVIGGAQTVIKAVYDKKDKVFLGIQVMGQGSYDLVSVFAMLIQLKIKVHEIPEFVYTNPLFNEFFNEVTEKLS